MLSQMSPIKNNVLYLGLCVYPTKFGTGRSQALPVHRVLLTSLDATEKFYPLQVHGLGQCRLQGVFVFMVHSRASSARFYVWAVSAGKKRLLRH